MKELLLLLKQLIKKVLPLPLRGRIESVLNTVRRLKVDVCIPEIKSAIFAIDTELTGTMWNEIQDRIAREAFENHKLRPDFLRTATVCGAVHPPQFKMGYEIVQKLKSTQFGCALLSRVQDSPVGNPRLIPQYPLLSSVGAQNIFYLHEIQRLLEIDIFADEIKFVDFGGGYGYLSKSIVLLNESARVEIIDLPIMLAIQTTYHANTLAQSQLERIAYNDSSKLLSDRAILHSFFERTKGEFHFNATFSLSECSLDIRRIVTESIISKSRTFFIVFQDHFNGIDNEKFFTGELPSICSQHETSVRRWPEHQSACILTGRRRG